VAYIPPADRKFYDADLETLHDGVPAWMMTPLMRWLEPFLEVTDDLGERYPNVEFIEGLEMNCRLRAPLNRSRPIADLQSLIEDDPSFGIRVIEYVIGTFLIIDNPPHHRGNGHLAPLQQILADSGSVWEVTALDVKDGYEGQKHLVLTRRDLAETKLAITDIRAQSDRAGSFLADAWKAIAAQDPRPGEAYDKAVKAIEAAAQPVVTPHDTQATLGKIIAAMRDKPSKWTFALGDLGTVIAMMDQVWTNHFRHGTQQRDDHTPQEADAAVHLALPLVRFFVGALIQPAQQ
jgi:hypothetical protein